MEMKAGLAAKNLMFVEKAPIGFIGLNEQSPAGTPADDEVF